MRLKLLIPGLLIGIIACQRPVQSYTPEVVVKKYVEAINASKFMEVSALLSDSAVFSEFEFELANSIGTWRTIFQWDSVFSPDYGIIKLETVGDTVFATLTKECRRIEFLQDTATTYKARFEFASERISKIHTYEYVFFDIDKWESRRDSIVSWIEANHKELSGFQFDQTIPGARNYLKAIELYQSRSNERKEQL